MEQITKSEVLDTSAGKLFTLKYFKETFYGLQPSANFTPHKMIFESGKLNQNQFLRQYKEKLKDYYLFEYQEGRTIKDIISELKAKDQEKKVEMIKKYLPQLLQALYQLHKQNILGRVFSTSNILDCGDHGILMMDFGFGPAFQQNDIEILAPPEIIYQLCSQNGQQANNGNSLIQDTCDLKIDSWLLGAFLFHIARSIPICSHKIYAKNPENVKETFKYKDIEEYQNFLKLNKMLGFTGINYQSQGCSISFCDLIEGLLQYDPVNRYSFSQIYKNKFVESLNIKDYDQILQFYEEFETRSKLIIGLQPNPQNQFESFINGISQFFVHRVQDIDSSQFEQIWYYFQMEQFKLFLLKETLEMIILFLDDNQKDIKHLSTYYLQKMILFQLSKLIRALENQENPQGLVIDDGFFKKFSELDQIKIFIEELKKELEMEKNTLRQYLKTFQDGIQNKKDFQEAFQLDIINIVNGVHEPNLNISDYQREIKKIFLKLHNPSLILVKYQDRQDELCLKLMICQDINVILNPQTIKNQFIQLNNNSNEIRWNQIYNYLNCKENQKLEIKRLEQIQIKN